MTPSDALPGILLVVSGAAGTGKSTVNSSLVSKYPEKYAFSVSATTRKPRPREIDGTDYHFVSREEFEKKIESGEMLEYTEYCGNYYGTPLSELSKLDEGKTLILEIETEGAQNVKRVRPDAVTVFIIPPDYETLKNRLVRRGTNTPEDIRNRLNKAIHEIRLAAKYDYAVVNRDGGIDEAVSAIDGIVESEKRRTSRLPSGTLEKMFPEISGGTDE